MINIQDICKRFGLLEALVQVRVEIRQGEFVALMGPNGAGKTTLIRILAGLSRPSSGRVCIADAWLDKEPQQVRSRIGVVSHHTFLYGDMTAEENLTFYGQMYGVADVGLRVQELLQQMELRQRRHDQVRTFSRGMQQRLSLARAIIHRPSVLLLDEPFTGLDVHASRLLSTFVQQFVAQGITVLMTLHDPDFGLEHAQRLLLLKNGRLELDQPTARVQRSQVFSLLDES